MKAMIVNRVGDIGLALAMFVTYSVFKSLDYTTIFSVAHLIGQEGIPGQISSLVSNENVLALIGVLLLVGAVGKSAQLGLHT
jgi:NADH:ubiquinone oxidoreductase subunit 5 (subunit L)/multisubunit Na+/H+ antiporter MnhA subunit